VEQTHDRAHIFVGCGLVQIDLERGMLKDIEHPQKGRVRVFMSPIHLSASKTIEPIFSPLLGQNNEEIFKELLGVEPNEIKKLKEENE
jgi:crotonobetainyl-CoA:carnitine CoA-transferase CaiB-like acyl-CoA transferase